MLPIGRKYNRLTVVENLPCEKGKALCRFKCECGNYIVARVANVVNGRTKSCGCAALEHAHDMNFRHGRSKERLYYVWAMMRRRCNSPENPAFKNYGARGISVCRAWGNYVVFRRWAYAHGYKCGLTIDRINVNKGYSPDNCRWVAPAEQARNQRRTVWVMTDIGRMCMAAAARHYGIVSGGTAYTRMRKLQWDAYRAVTTPSQRKHNNKKEAK